MDVVRIKRLKPKAPTLKDVQLLQQQHQRDAPEANTVAVQMVKPKPRDPKRLDVKLNRLRLLHQVLAKTARKPSKAHRKALPKYARAQSNALHATMNHSVAVQMDKRQLMDPMEKDVVCNLHTVAVPITLVLLEDQTPKDAAANTHHTVAVQTTKLLPQDMIMPVAAANIPAMAAALINLHPPKDPNLRAAHAIHSNSVAVRMVSPPRMAHTITDATAHKLNTSAVPMRSPQPRDPTTRDAHAFKANTAVVWTASPKRKDVISRVAIACRPHHRRLAVSGRREAIAPTTRSNTSTMSNMVVAHVSGTAVAAATIIASKLWKIARPLAKNLLERALVNYQRFMDLAPATIQCTTMTSKEILARNSSSADAWVTTTDSRQSKRARNSVWSMIHCVSLKYTPVCPRIKS